MSLRVSQEVIAEWDGSTELKRRLAHWDPAPGDVAAIRGFLGERSNHGGVWLDWGCGGGALMQVASSAETMLAVDVSRETLARLPARDGMEVMRLEPHDTQQLAAGVVDTICSFSCFQHFPDNEYGLAVLKEMRRLAKHGAHGFIQTRYYEKGDYCDPSRLASLSYAERIVKSCAYGVGEFWGALKFAGFEPTHVELETYRQYAWYRFEVRS